MRILNVASAVVAGLILVSANLHAQEASENEIVLNPAATYSDSFQNLLKAQAELQAKELEKKRNSMNPPPVVPAAQVVTADPLPNAVQEVKPSEPTLEAIWGMAGKEVAEINYKGKRIPVSKVAPYISKIDGWQLENIEPFQISLVQKKGEKIINRKVIPLSWQSNIGNE